MPTEMVDADLVAICERRGLALRPSLAIIALANERIDEARSLLSAEPERPAIDPEVQQVLAAFYVGTKRMDTLKRIHILHGTGITSTELYRLERGLPVKNKDRCIARLKQLLHDNGITLPPMFLVSHPTATGPMPECETTSASSDGGATPTPVITLPSWKPTPKKKPGRRVGTATPGRNMKICRMCGESKGFRAFAQGADTCTACAGDKPATKFKRAATLAEAATIDE